MVMSRLSDEIETVKVHSYAYAQSLVTKSETKFDESLEESAKAAEELSNNNKKKLEGIQASLLKNVQSLNA